MGIRVLPAALALMASAALTAALLCLTPIAGAAPDEPPAVRIAFQPAPGVRHVADYEERAKMTALLGKTKPIVAELTALWKVEFVAGEKRRDGAIPLDFKVASLSGQYVGADGTNTFDGETGKCDGKLNWPDEVRSVLATTGKSGTVVVSAAGEALEGPDAFRGLSVERDSPARRKQVVVAFLERFLQALPAVPVKQGAAWVTPRWVAPHFVVATQHMCGAVDERCKAVKLDEATLDVTISGSGTTASSARKLEPSLLPNKLTKWSITGAASVDRATGVALSRTTHVELKREEYFKEFDVTTKYEYSIDTKLSVQRLETTPSGK